MAIWSLAILQQLDGERMKTDASQHFAASVFVVIALSILLVAVTSLLVLARSSDEECTNFSAGRSIGIGAVFMHDDIGFCGRNWVSDITALSVCFLAPSSGGNFRVAVQTEKKMLDSCYMDAYLALRIMIPATDNMTWQRLDGSVGTELSFFDVPEFALSVEMGVSIVHYYTSTWGWRWRSESFAAVSLDFYP
jgi:hypothetical protein